MATISDIARAANVSPAVVSRLVNGDSSLRVGAETRSRVLRVIAEMDYAPNAAARSLRSARTGLIALVMHNVTNPAYAEIITGAQHAAAEHGMAVLLGEALDNRGGLKTVNDLIGGGGVDGLILQGAGAATDRSLARAARRRMPTVLLQSGEAETATLLSLPDAEAARIATEHLIGLGHRRIGCIGTVDGLPFTENRKTGWREALARRGISAPPGWYVAAGSDLDAGAAGARRLLESGPEITAVVVCNVVAAIGAMAGFHDAGVTVPEDLSVVALHDNAPARYVRPALTVVRMPMRQLGEAAVRAIRDPEPGARHVVIDEPGPSLVQRQSTMARPG